MAGRRNTGYGTALGNAIVAVGVVAARWRWGGAALDAGVSTNGKADRNGSGNGHQTIAEPGARSRPYVPVPLGPEYGPPVPVRPEFGPPLPAPLEPEYTVVRYRSRRELRPAPVPVLRPARHVQLLRAARTFLVVTVVGGLLIGLGLAALIPGTTQIATAHKFTPVELPPLSRLSERSIVYAADGSQLDVLGLKDREAVPLDQVPSVVINAVVATEDKTFWENSGVDPNGLLRAFMENVSAGEIEQGGSSITQQLVKNRLFQANQDLDLKIREIVYAYRMNQEYTKEEILQEYLNTVYFGSGSYGIKTAAERMFLTPDPVTGLRGKRLNELTLGEAALLAGLIANPEGDNPFRYPERAEGQRAESLRQMYDQGYISRRDMRLARNEPLPIFPPPAERRPHNYFVEEVQDRLLQDPRLGETPRERRNALLRGGLRIYTTLDPVAQARAEAAVNEVLPPGSKPGFAASLVSIEPSTGAVRAMVGGPGFDELEYNIATTTPGRHVGSSWKMITLMTALEAGYSPNDLVDGSSPCEVRNPVYGSLDRTVNSEGGGGGRGTLRSQTVGSVNCAFFRLLASVGPNAAIDMAHRLGITQPQVPNLSMTLGTTETTMLEMATVAATIANRGSSNSPIFVQRVTKPNGRVVFDETGRAANPVVDPAVADCATDVLRGVVSGGTGTAAQLPGRPAAGKTGTTDFKWDAVFVGYVPQLATAVWHGAIGQLTPGAGFGGEIPATIWGRYMSAQMADQPVIDFPGGGSVCAREGQVVTDTGRTDLAFLDDFFRNDRRQQRQEDRRNRPVTPPTLPNPPPNPGPPTLPPPPTLPEN